MSEDEYIKATDRTKLRIAYGLLRDILGGYEPVTSEWLRETLTEISKAVKQFDAMELTRTNNHPAKELLVELDEEGE